MKRDAQEHAGATRRGLLKLGVLLALVSGSAGVSALLRRRNATALDSFEPVPDAPGFLRSASAQVTRGNPVLLGLETEPGPGPLSTGLCDALFRADRRPDQTAIAYFTDARCAICRVMSPLMTELDARPDIAMRWHELPLLGPMSEQAARAALAAGQQDAYAFFQKRLAETPVLATPEFLRDLSRQAGIDAERLLQDMHGPAVDRQLRDTASLARRFGFLGTPALVVGSVAVLGRVDRAGMDRLIQLARSRPAAC
ncbi:DsbA family protein [Maliponia aquimaris]|uniref:DSBA-like thioredoxin domain protein n=1 Tax=Maliponia aquimaris TaxID=1673631 RepID=A0A238JSU1_9RHOB|nr:DsbA family protein [Maliponia aquimaris]SMX33645.1 DSBA-like thioredoxin domain protein [Maliponia aquimaris]